MFSKKLVLIDFYLRNKAEASPFLSFKVEFQVHVVYFSSLSSVWTLSVSFIQLHFHLYFFRLFGVPERLSVCLRL